MDPIKRKFILSEIRDYLGITFGLLLFAFSWTIFLLPYQIVTGGITGIAAILYYWAGIPLDVTFFSINIILLVFALKILGLKFMMKTIYAIFMLTVLLHYAQILAVDVHGETLNILGPNNAFMAVIVGCTLTGSALGIVFLFNGSTGGTDIIAAIVNKYHNISLGRVLTFVDFIIVGSTIPIFHNWQMLILGFITIVVECGMLDYLMNIMRQSVQFLIFTKHHKEICKAIADATDHTMTLLDGHGWYTGNEMKVICILARRRESTLIFRIIKSIDSQAFVSQSSVIGVYGEGFDKIKTGLPNNTKSHEA